VQAEEKKQVTDAPVNKIQGDEGFEEIYSQIESTKF
jgi:hypothetical protein